MVIGPELRPQTATLGGLTYELGDVENAVKRTDGTFLIEFKTGEKLVYGQQTNGATVNLNVKEGKIFDDAYYDISNVMGATFSSSKKSVSHVKLNDCKSCVVNLGKNGSVKYPDTVKDNNHGYNTILLDVIDKDYSDTRKGTYR